MKFLGLFARSAAGSALASLLFNVVVASLIVGVAPVVAAAIPLAIQAAVAGVIFGLVYSLVHIKREPTLVSSFGTGLGYIALMTVLGIVLGTFAGFSLASLAGILITAALLGGGAYLGTRIGR